MSPALPTEPDKITWEDLGASPEMRDALVTSATFLQLFSPEMVTDPTSDPLPLLQLGVAIMLDKPVIVMAARSDEAIIPEHLRRAADRIVFYDGADMRNPATVAALTDAIRSLSPED